MTLTTKITSFTLVVFGIVMLSIIPAHASTGIPVTPGDLTTATCDASYYESLKSRAWLEGQRRLRQAQNMIRKPDSVLDYSCFSILNNIAAEFTERIFSESHAGHCFPDSLDCSLDRLVIAALGPYLTTNFNHTFLGGRSALARQEYDPDSTEMCTVMRDVWMAAKCQIIIPEPDQDGFLDFSVYAGTDPRALPEPCTNNVASEWNNNIENAFRPAGASLWHDPILTSVATAEANYTQYLGPGDTGGSGPGCGEYIYTGLIQFDVSSIFFRTPEPDGLCPNPACTNNGLGQCVLMSF